MRKDEKAESHSVPRALRVWFVVHCVVDVLFAVPLMIMPEYFLTLLGWHTVDPLTARLVSAALLGIGVESFLGRHSDVSGFMAMLNLKIIWSSGAVIGLLVSLVSDRNGPPIFGWVFLAIFSIFNMLWAYWRWILQRQFS